MAEEDEKNADAGANSGENFSSEFASVAHDFKKLAQASRDPLAVAAMLDRLTEERKSTNLVLKEISRKLEKLDELESRISGLEAKIGGKASLASQSAANEEALREPQAPQPPLLPEIDESILGFVRKHGRATAEEVQRKCRYKGANAASARLNGLFKLGLLEKRQVGRKVFFIAK